jgi:hypothetical protein
VVFGLSVGGDLTIRGVLCVRDAAGRCDAPSAGQMGEAGVSCLTGVYMVTRVGSLGNHHVIPGLLRLFLVERSVHVRSSFNQQLRS